MSDKNAAVLAAMRDAVLNGDQAAAERLAREALEQGVAPLEAIEGGFVPGIRKAGDLWEEGEYFLPELVTSAQAMKAAMAIVQPALAKEQKDRHSAGRVVIGTVQGDIHDIGKTLVGTMLSANGFEVSDEGADVPVERFVERAKEVDADLICASALLTTTMTAQRQIVERLKEAGLRARVMVGGAPVSKDWAEQIGAAGFADNAVAAVAVAQGIMARDS
jgi:trimethylamine corrinoid protein